jgi:ubiquitin thioesterase protein OTUB1
MPSMLCDVKGMLDDPVTVEQFCRRYVEPMGEESDHIHIVAITDALQVCPITA